MKEAKNKPGARRRKFLEDLGYPVGKLVKVPDFLPPPEVLRRARGESEKVKVTIELDDYTVDFFKELAALGTTSYQRLIRTVLSGYSRSHQDWLEELRKEKEVADSILGRKKK